MPSNIEIKARVADLAALRRTVRDLCPGPEVLIHQDDTFFACAHGRLKLRDFSSCPPQGELIHYERPDTHGPKLAAYRRTPTADPEALRDTLSDALGVIGRVIKIRRLYRYGRTRIHLDEVADLGSFMELEVVLAADEDPAAGMACAHALMQRLGIDTDTLCEGAYLDLLNARTSSS